MNIRFVKILFFFSALISSAAIAHSGGTNANGCHTNSKTGDYHCHNSKPQVNYDTYCHVLNGERRCGYAKSSCQSLVRQHGGYCSK